MNEDGTQESGARPAYTRHSDTPDRVDPFRKGRWLRHPPMGVDKEEKAKQQTETAPAIPRINI